MAYINGHKIIYTSYNGKQFFVDKAYEAGQPVGPSWLPTNGLEEAKAQFTNTRPYYADFAFHYTTNPNGYSHRYVRVTSAAAYNTQIVVINEVFIGITKNPEDWDSSAAFYAEVLEYRISTGTWVKTSSGGRPNYYEVLVPTNTFPVDKYACIESTEISVVNNSGLPFEMYV